jgi:arabinan endo-1,5-alpha-L-arabinosidase
VRRAGTRRRARARYFWTYDPDVLGDTRHRQGILYYGSYYGGHVRHRRRFTETGVTARDGRPRRLRIAIGNRYEGSNVVFRDGYYYLFASATNCCNGALTGYSVFVGRSTEPARPVRRPRGQLLPARASAARRSSR